MRMVTCEINYHFSNIFFCHYYCRYIFGFYYYYCRYIFDFIVIINLYAR